MIICISFLKANSTTIVDTIDGKPLSSEIGSFGFSFESKEFQYKPIGTVHGGLISTPVDAAIRCSIHSTLLPGFAFST